MLNIKLDTNKGEAVIEASGSAMDMAGEILYVIAHIYKTLGRQSQISAEGFKLLTQAAVENENGAVWNGEVGGEGIEICFSVPQKGGGDRL